MGVKGECTLTENPRLNGICSADVLCDGTTENAEDLKNSWDCIRTGGRFYNHYSQSYDYELVDNYYLYFYVSDVDINISEDPLSGIDVGTKITTLNINNGNLVSVPIITSSLPTLTELSVTYNKVETVNLRKLSGVSMVALNVSHNCISSIEFDEIENTVSSKITSIDLSYNYLESLPDNCFEMFLYLKYLDLSYNKLKQFDVLTFEGMTKLETLKLSNNEISDIDQNLARFRNLKHLTLDNNQLTSLTNLNFKTLTSLENLNISSNMIKHIDDQSFATLRNIAQLDLSHNKIINIHQSLFKNNIKMNNLSLSQNYIETIEGGAFRNTNISHFDIQNNYMSGSIEYDTFLGISVESLDLSKGYLKELGDKAFSALSKDLRYLNLSSNLIENVTESAFQALEILSTLDLSCNHLIDINLNTSDLHQLSEYYLQNNFIKKITPNMFKNMTRLTTLDLSQNKIDNIELNSFIELVSLLDLNISRNNFVDSLKRNTFRGLYKPGTFLSNNMINTMNLYGNNLQSLKFGVLDGLRNLRVLNLSNNEIHTFGVNLLHTSPFLTELFLENNKLESIDLGAFSKTGVQLLTIGGNSISCDALADWAKISNDEFNVTAESFNFDFENINGIGCKTSYSQKKTHDENNNLNITSNVSEMKETVGRLYSYFSKDVNAIFSKIIALLEKKTEDVDQVPPNFDHSQMVLSTHLEKILNENKDLLPQLVRTNDNVANYIKRMISLLEINNNLTILGNNQKEMLQTPVSSKTIEKHNKNNSVDIGDEPLEVKFDRNTLIDIKTLLYIIAVCLAIMVLFCIIAISYKYLYRGATHRIRSNYLYDSGQSVRNGLEME
ncbi:jg5872 [Pararge aegeria aegeria]|uniref:Jg5872 protein n=1 Tax=Pararge aegeria aegeria TaxID=348720 RepID=A0A8S4RGK3_9NEOP|nr:jg5872 [Pararge aegeria aegeria]